MSQLDEEKSRAEALRVALERLETTAGTPVVSGEMENWLAALEQAFAQLQAVVDRHVRQSHAPQIASIKREDPEMFRNVDELQKEDGLIVEAIRGALARLAVLKPMVQRIEPDEKRAELALAELGEQAVQLVVRIRKQEVVIRTWLQEAFTRDRGVVD
jgi:hypothetical protein